MAVEPIQVPREGEKVAIANAGLRVGTVRYIEQKGIDVWGVVTEEVGVVLRKDGTCIEQISVVKMMVLSKKEMGQKCCIVK